MEVHDLYRWFREFRMSRTVTWTQRKSIDISVLPDVIYGIRDRSVCPTKNRKVRPKGLVMIMQENYHHVWVMGYGRTGGSGSGTTG